MEKCILINKRNVRRDCKKKKWKECNVKENNIIWVKYKEIRKRGKGDKE